MGSSPRPYGLLQNKPHVERCKRNDGNSLGARRDLRIATLGRHHSDGLWYEYLLTRPQVGNLQGSYTVYIRILLCKGSGAILRCHLCPHDGASGIMGIGHADQECRRSEGDGGCSIPRKVDVKLLLRVCSVPYHVLGYDRRPPSVSGASTTLYGLASEKHFVVLIP